MGRPRIYTPEEARERRHEQKVLNARRFQAKARDVDVPKVANPSRRKRLERDVLAWLRWYMPEKYCHPFTDDQIMMVREIERRIKHGGDKTIAADRGGGKTSIVEGVIIFAALKGMLRFAVMCASTTDDGKRLLANIKREIETNDRLLEDYPEVCHLVRATEGSAIRANRQTHRGKSTRLRWSKDIIVLPSVARSPASGVIITARGLDAAVRGVKEGNTRPDFVLIDDPDTRESAHSETQTAAREQIIEQDLAGLAGPRRRITRVMLCTIINRRCLAFKYTDRAVKPSWRGERLRLLRRRPEREDLWARYVEMRNEGMRRTDKPDIDGREANAFYLANRAEMDRGAEVSNPHRFFSDPSSDGSPLQSSTVQFCYDVIADRGEAAFNAEYQNDPPEEEAIRDVGLTAGAVQERVNGLERWVVPDDALIVTAGIDLGKRALHYAQVAWSAAATGWVVDYGVEEVHLMTGGDPNSAKQKQAEERAIYLALHAWRDRMLADPLRRANGEPIAPSIVFIDNGNGDWNAVVAEFLRQVGGAPFAAAKGFGGGDATQFRAPSGTRGSDMIGDHWYVKHLPSGVWQYALDADYWKRQVHERMTTPPGADGSLSLWGEDKRAHFSYARHIVSEVWREPSVAKGRLRRGGWYLQNKNNHWLDATYMALAAASVRGVSLVRQATRPTTGAGSKQTTQRRQPARDLVGAGRQGGGWSIRPW